MRLGVRSIKPLQRTKHIYTSLRIKHKDFYVWISDPVSMTAVSITCRKCGAINESTPVGDAEQFGLSKPA
jgi:hypothetical protein